MKRLGIGLYDKIISIDNLYDADANAQKGKAYRPEVMEHNANKHERLQALHDMLAKKTYTPSPYHTFKVKEPKEREIAALPYYPDRIIHHAILNVLEPVWRKVFTHNTYACLKGRGISACQKQVRRIIDGYNERGERCYCLKIDIRHFYPSVDSTILKAFIRKRIKCKDTLWLLDTIIDSAQGLPIGNYVSQYFANLYLAYFMHEVNDRGLTAVEYMDDIVFFDSDKARLHRLLKTFIVPSINALHLEVKDNYQVFPIATARYTNGGRPLDYVGYTFYTHHTGIRKRIKKRFARKVANLRRKGINGKRLFTKTSSYTGWCKHAQCTHLATTIMRDESKHIKWLNQTA